MRLDLHTLQIAAMVAVFALLYAARATKGNARQTTDGLSFPLKPMVVVSRGLALPLYFLLFAYPLWISRQSIPPWLLIMIFAVTLFALFQLPGTIVLSPTAVTQSFWLRRSKRITYPEVMGVAASPRSAVTRVLGSNRTSITHTFNHADAAGFRSELQARLGKPLSL